MFKGTTLVVVVLAGLGLSACATAVKQKDDMLAAAGFQIKPADTPERLALLKRLPPHKLTMRTTPNGSVSFLYADPTICKCLYFGDETAYSTYRQIASARASLLLSPSVTSSAAALTASSPFFMAMPMPAA